jgi:hypothetical protein
LYVETSMKTSFFQEIQEKVVLITRKPKKVPKVASNLQLWAIVCKLK